jgi:hypothetical protein
MDPDSMGFVDQDPYGEQEGQDDQQRKAVFRIHMFYGLGHPDPLVRGMDPDPSIGTQK